MLIVNCRLQNSGCIGRVNTTFQEALIKYVLETSEIGPISYHLPSWGPGAPHTEKVLPHLKLCLGGFSLSSLSSGMSIQQKLLTIPCSSPHSPSNKLREWFIRRFERPCPYQCLSLPRSSSLGPCVYWENPNLEPGVNMERPSSCGLYHPYNSGVAP